MEVRIPTSGCSHKYPKPEPLHPAPATLPLPGVQLRQRLGRAFLASRWPLLNLEKSRLARPGLVYHNLESAMMIASR